MEADSILLSKQQQLSPGANMAAGRDAFGEQNLNNQKWI